MILIECYSVSFRTLKSRINSQITQNVTKEPQRIIKTHLFEIKSKRKKNTSYKYTTLRAKINSPQYQSMHKTIILKVSMIDEYKRRAQ